MKNGIKIIIIGGLYRSGSVWQYNIIRTILELAGYTCGFSGTLREKHWKNIKTDYHVLKLHRILPHYLNIADYTFSSVRNLFDVKRSRELIANKTFTNREIIQMFNWAYFWMIHSDYVMIFDHIMTKQGKIKVVNEIKSILGFSNVNTNKVIEIVDNIRPPQKGQDKKTMLFANHIGKEANWNI